MSTEEMKSNGIHKLEQEMKARKMLRHSNPHLGDCSECMDKHIKVWLGSDGFSRCAACIYGLRLV